jgi:hypothetical protein
MCNTDVETNHHILTCDKCPIRNKIKYKYLSELGNVFDKNRIDPSTKTVITHNVQNWLNNKAAVALTSIEPNATKTLYKAATEQQQIGWDQWFKGRWSSEWATLINHDLQHTDAGIKHNSSTRFAKEVILLTWNYIYDVWTERNKCEHDEDGSPDLRRKEKLIETIQGISLQMNYQVYTNDELEYETLITLPVENLVMIETNLKNARESKKNRKVNMPFG